MTEYILYGERFSLIDIMLAYWTENIDPVEMQDNYQGLHEFVRRVIRGPLLAPYFGQLHDMLAEYSQLQRRVRPYNDFHTDVITRV